mmetsp:Transcript_6111/g.20358  ORF Transcript_6111/g.20358 Transcript_6111/m.20358 type:complete len:203 (+) Transcript_6111:2148-2756(+)
MALITSWPITPPNMAAMGDTYPFAVLASVVTTAFGSTSSSFWSAGALALISFAIATMAAASSGQPGVGNDPPLDLTNRSSAVKPRCNTGPRSNFAKSLSRNSPGSAVACARVLNASFFCSFICVAMPPPVYGEKSVVSTPWSLNECALTSLMTYPPTHALSSVIPRVSVNITRWPSCSSTRSSSTQVTIGVVSLETLAMIQE